MEFIKLFETMTIHGLTIKNRIVMPSMGLAYTHNYTLNDRYAAFYRERARGGVGLMTIGPFGIDRAGSVPLMLGLFEDDFVPPLKGLIDEIRCASDCKVAAQLLHMGRYSFSALTGITPMAPSAIRSKLTGETPREMTQENIEEVQEAYAHAGRRAKKAGFDAVEILACTGYLISQFLSPLTNQRADQYGGDLSNRMRFGLEVIAKVRATVGDDMPLGIRIAGNDFMQGGHTNRESVLFAAEAEKAGIHYINVTGGWHETDIPQLTGDVPAGGFLYLARGIREKVRVPVFASNRLGDPLVAERALRSGACDAVCWGRPLIADPELPNKVREGRLKEIIPCISCNQGCFDTIFSGSPVGCVLNPRAGREADLTVQRTLSPKKIMVAGGGPAGMAFALTAAERGHRVTLYEQGDRLGGQVNLAMAPPGKGEFRKVIQSMAHRLARWEVDVRLNTVLTPEMVMAAAPDVLVVSTGASPLPLNVPGSDKAHVIQAWEVLLDKITLVGGDVVVVGGSATGCETAMHIAAMGAPDPNTFAFLMFHAAEDPTFAVDLLHHSGRKITVIDLVPRLADNVGKTARWSLMKGLRLMGVSLRPGTGLLEIRDDGVLVETARGQETIPADTVVLATGVRSVDDLTRALEGKGIQLITIGDAKSPRKLTDAIREGFEEAVRI